MLTIQTPTWALNLQRATRTANRATTSGAGERRGASLHIRLTD
jgi:hypothetical protein